MRRKHTNPLSHYATRYNVSIATVKRWSAKGLNLDDPKAINWQVVGQRHEPPKLRNTGPQNSGPLLLIEDKGEQAALALIEMQGVFLRTIPLIASGNNVEGMNREQTVAGHQRLALMLVEDFWRQLVLIFMQGLTFEQAKAKVDAEPFPESADQPAGTDGKEEDEE